MFDYKEKRYTSTPTSIIDKSNEQYLNPEQKIEYAEVKRKLSGKFCENLITLRISSEEKKILIDIARKNDMYSITQLLQNIVTKLTKGMEIDEVAINMTHGLEDAYH